jgi:SOUL heme-binding protein
MKKVCLVPLLLGLLVAIAPPRLRAFTLPRSLDRTRQKASSSSSSSSSSFPCFLIRSSSTTTSHSGKRIPFFATLVPSSSSSSSLLTDEDSAKEEGSNHGVSSTTAIPIDVLLDKKTTVSVYNKTPVSKHIMLTDYLRNPRSLQQKMATATATATTTATRTAPKPAVEKDEEDSRQQIMDVPLSTSSSALLEEAISTFDNAAAKQILAKLAEMRRANVDPAVIADWLDGFLLLERAGPDEDHQQGAGGLPLWTRLRFLSRFSKRARLASLRRTLDLVTPPTMSASSESSSSSSTQDDALDVESKKRRRRRAFVSILNTLAKPLLDDGDDDDDDDDDEKNNDKKQQKRGGRSLPAIAILEKKARCEQRGQGSSLQQGDDLIVRRPKDLETPSYTIVAKRQGRYGFEIRRYEPYALCSVNMAQARPPDSYKTFDAVISEPKLKGASSFGALAGYLFGKNQAQTAMKMTTPVFTTLSSNSNDSDDKDDTSKRLQDETMSFVLPSEFWKDDESLSLAPQPLEGSGVTLERIDGGHRAVVMFGGYATRDNVATRKRELLQKLDKDPDWRAVTICNNAANDSPPDNSVVGNKTSDHDFALAQYNDPFTPPWKRLNEISIAVERR